MGFNSVFKGLTENTIIVCACVSERMSTALIIN